MNFNSSRGTFVIDAPRAREGVRLHHSIISTAPFHSSLPQRHFALHIMYSISNSARGKESQQQQQQAAQKPRVAFESKTSLPKRSLSGRGRGANGVYIAIKAARKALHIYRQPARKRVRNAWCACKLDTHYILAVCGILSLTNVAFVYISPARYRSLRIASSCVYICAELPFFAALIGQ